MEFGYQATIVRALGRFVSQGLVYKGKKPVHWCIHCRTALAEAEVEYEPHGSPSIYVEFPLAEDAAEDLAARVPELKGRPVSALIWTTTPWTIPSNLALAFHPEAVYGAYDVDGRAVIVAEDLAARLATQVKRSFGAPRALFPGRTMEGVRFRHPLYQRDSVGVLAEYVTLDTGTGVVHTAPGHGSDDFHTGLKYGLDIYAPVGPGGHFLDNVERFGGQRVFDANPRIEEALATAGRLWHRETFEHSYPHCWRCHNPVIFLATSQWFIRMDAPLAGGRTLRNAALDAIGGVTWVPSWGKDRIFNMVANRPDWCISRQRAWGVPIPALDCQQCGEAVLTPGLVERTAAVFDQHGADAWYERPLEEFVPDGLTCPSCGATRFERERDILDVWFDSGSSHEAVLPFRPELTWPADMYLEGSDQHRGWFHSSLLVGLGTRGAAPYRQVLTHGFVVTEDGHKMSKSLGNDIPPEEVIARSGAEVLRLWASMVDYREEVRFGPEIMARVIEAYRKIRNTCRILVANLYDFDPARDAVAAGDLEEVDRYALARYNQTARRILEAYDTYDFQIIFHALNTYTAVDLSAFYVDVMKDRLYTLAATSRSRRAGQTVMFTIVDGLTRLMAPILPVTADELWKHLPGERERSVHLADFPAIDAVFDDDALVARWARLIDIRDRVNQAIEVKRQEKTIGNSLAANVRIRASGHDGDLLVQARDLLPSLFIVSAVDADRGTGDVPLAIEVSRSEGHKCERCWRHVQRLATDPAYQGICLRCADALAAS
jgi:isoleucyl-tRNA synthetase